MNNVSQPKADILLVDDTPENLRVLSQMLTTFGYKARAVTDGGLALTVAQAAPPDLIMMDVNMPTMDGYEACERLKADERTNKIPVIFLSAMGEVEDKVRAFKAGGVDYVTKPFQIDEVLARLETHLSIRRLQMQLEAANQLLAARLDELSLAQAAERQQRLLAETLVKTTAAINGSLDYNEVLDLILENMANVVPHDTANIALLDKNGTVQILRARGYKQRGLQNYVLSLQYPLQRFPTWLKTARNRTIEIIQDTQLEPDWVTIPEMAWCRSHACVPIISKDQVIGFLNMDSSIPGYFIQEQVNRLRTFADQAAVAIEKARLFHNEQRRAEQFRIITEFSQRITSILDVERLMQEIVAEIKTSFHYDTISIGLVNADNLVMSQAAGLDIENHPPLQAKIGERGIASWVAYTGHPIIVPDVSQEPHYVPWPEDTHTQSELAVPLKIGDQVIGVLNVESNQLNTFDESDLATVQSLANQAAVAIENARLFQEIQRLASIDGLTGASNRRHLLHLAQNEYERFRRFDRPLSALMMDLDHFKKVNDTYGHPVGDQALIALTQCSLENLRATDVFGRYGGEEFLVLLPETDMEHAMQVAERLREEIANITLPSSKGPLHITISIGIATLEPGSELDLDQLIVQADDALYVAKAQGRNRVCAAK